MRSSLDAEALVRDRIASYGRAKPLDSTAAALANTRLFSTCSRRELKTVAKVAKFKKVAAGTVLMREGDTGETMFVIVSGIARVSRNGRKVATLGAGDAVGELAVLGRTARNATVEAESQLDVAELSRVALARLISDVPAFSRKLLEALANRVRELDSRSL